MNVELIGSKLKISAAGTAVVGGTEWYFFLFCFFAKKPYRGVNCVNKYAD